MYILRYDGELTFSVALLFGSLISAIEPGEAAALLTEHGVSRKLVMLIKGEDYFSHGAAFVMFYILLDVVIGKSYDAGDIASEFFRLSCGGPALGIIVGIIISFWLKRIINNPILETNITIVAIYLLFYISEFTELHVSGMLALVTLGIYMAKEGKTNISAASQETLRHIWSYLLYA